MLEIVPVTQAEAFAMIVKVHRHFKRPPEGWACGVGLARDGVLVGAGLLARPVAPKTSKDKGIAEIGRVAVPEDLPRVLSGGREHASSANSRLYAALRDAARALGYWKVQTFTVESESGASLRAVGFKLVRPASEDTPRKPGQWDSNRRTGSLFPELEPEIASEPKNRWECLLRKEPPDVADPTVLALDGRT